MRVAITSLYPAEQAALSEASAAARLASLPAMDKAAGPVFMRSFTELIPTNCTPASIKRLDAAATQYKDLSAGTRRALLGARQEDQRCLLIQKTMTLPKT